eukprot:CAMPEP_0197890986 /NCGR_PEP_ID=MMETSP1439-20131203/27315_1 /TAXON_ID=66791 /ORGANISM="Gonyaulax spinifera, Strain CCMP409" /LENGTH=158 /DNA_ID=CAMNT_0043511059 /DNA_START=90 /DNA_END=566 /DNA_ORIENTATION=+
MSQFEQKEFNVTDTGCQILCCLCCPLTFMPLIPGIMGSKKMILEPEEAVYEYQCGICNGTTRRPYGELGSVDKSNCLCCVGVTSGLTKDQPIFVGCGCEEAKVDEIVAELKRRMKGRGDTAQINRAEETLELVRLLGKKVDLILDHHGIAVPGQQSMT